MELLTESEVSSILRSVKDVFVHSNIFKLTNPAYNFVMLSSGFIAHYNIEGFRWEYQHIPTFAECLIYHQRMNQWNNFRPGEKDYEYMMQKKKIYNEICDYARQYLANDGD